MKPIARTLGEFYRGKRVLVTGHTGLKGSWLALWLDRMGARVHGIALPPPSPLSSFSANQLETRIASTFADVRELPAIRKVFADFAPEIVFHLAAQAIVGLSYEDPVATFDVNVTGSVNVLECARSTPSVRTTVMITSDKCYQNVEQIWGYRETERLGGDDPYSASKACAEIAIRAYAKSFFAKEGSGSVASARAGNVIGGGDWSKFRLIPDCIRSLRERQPIQIRHPKATRPWQFVLDPLAGYLLLGRKLATDGKSFGGAWNFGPPVDNNNTVERGVNQLIARWGSGQMELVPTSFHENSSLQLDSTKSSQHLGWRTLLNFDQTIEWTARWYKEQHACSDGKMLAFSHAQIDEFEKLMDERLGGALGGA